LSQNSPDPYQEVLGFYALSKLQKNRFLTEIPRSVLPILEF
jgi:hypothetical protein